MNGLGRRSRLSSVCRGGCRDLHGRGRSHPFLGFVGNPTLDGGFSALGFWGALGFPPPRRDAGRVLIGIFGGSLAGDFSGPGAERLRERLSAAEPFRGREIVFVNTGYGGYKQPQQLFCLAWVLALGGELDAIVNIDGFNEVALDGAENAHQGVFPAFPRSWALRVADLDDRSLLALVGRVAFLEDQRSAWAARRATAIWRYSPTARLLSGLRERAIVHRLTEARLALNSYRPPKERFVATGPGRDVISGDIYRHLAKLWSDGSLQMNRLCQANGIRYFHFLQPNQYVSGSKVMGRREQDVAIDPSHPYREGVVRGYPELRRAGADLVRQGVIFRDLTLLFASVSEPLFIDTCCHLNDRGLAKLADAIAVTMIENWHLAVH